MMTTTYEALKLALEEAMAATDYHPNHPSMRKWSEALAASNAAPAVAPEQTETAREALDSLDDYARMDTGVDAFGPRGVLERFIDSVAANAAQGGEQATRSMSMYANIEDWRNDNGTPHSCGLPGSHFGVCPACKSGEQERCIEDLRAETRRAHDAMIAAETRLIMERERGDMWQQKYLGLAAEAKPEGKICEMWGVWYEGSRVGISGWVEDGSGCPELFPSVDKARLFCPSSAYQVRPIVMYAAAV